MVPPELLPDIGCQEVPEANVHASHVQIRSGTPSGVRCVFGGAPEVSAALDAPANFWHALWGAGKLANVPPVLSLLSWYGLLVCTARGTSEPSGVRSANYVIRRDRPLGIDVWNGGWAGGVGRPEVKPLKRLRMVC